MCGVLPAPHAPIIVAASGASSSVTGTTVMTTPATVTIPANTVKPGDAIIRVNSYWTTNPSANNKTYRSNISGLQNSSGMLSSLSTGGSNPAIAVLSQWIVLDGGLLHTVASQGSPYGAAGDYSQLLDWTRPQTLNLTGQLVVSTDVLTLRGYMVEVLNP